jgi:ribosomal protein L11 methyltransferase
MTRRDTESDGWLARTVEAFPEQEIGRRFLIRPTHVAPRPTYGRIALTLDAGLAFGSGEHASTQGCLMAVERVPKRARRVLDVGSGSGILAMGAAKLWHVKALATDIDPWSVRVAEENAKMNGLKPSLRAILATGYNHRAIKRGAPYDLIFANILARPLCAMACDLAAHLQARRHGHPGGAARQAGADGAGRASARGAGAGTPHQPGPLGDAGAPQAGVRASPASATSSPPGTPPYRPG